MEQAYRKIFDSVHAPAGLWQTVENIPQLPHKKSRLRLVWALAACLAVLCAISVITVGKFLSEITVKPVMMHRETVGYEIDFFVPRRKLANFSTQLQQDAAAMKQAKEESARYFDNWQDAETYLGFSVPNPLEDQDWLTRDSHCAFRCDCTQKKAHCQVYLEGGIDNQVVRVTTTAGYLCQGVWVLLTGRIDTEFMPAEDAFLTYGHYYHEPIKYTVEDITTPRGFNGAIIHINAYDTTTCVAYVLCDNICYQIELLPQYGSIDSEVLLRQLLTCF